MKYPIQIEKIIVYCYRWTSNWNWIL